MYIYVSVEVATHFHICIYYMMEKKITRRLHYNRAICQFYFR